MRDFSLSNRATIVLLLAAGVISGAAGCGREDPKPETSGSTTNPAAPMLTIAAARGDLHMVQALLATGADADERGAGGRTALMAAASDGRGSTADALLAAGADADAEDIGGHSALTLAARAGADDVVAALIAAGADVNHATADGITVLMEGIRSGEIAVVDRLLIAGADVRATSARGLTALHLAAAGSVDVMERVLATGLEIDATDWRGLTPIMRAARTGKLDLVRLLAARGADLTLVDAEGSDAADHARRRKHWHVADYLDQRLGPAPSVSRFDTPAPAPDGRAAPGDTRPEPG